MDIEEALTHFSSPKGLATVLNTSPHYVSMMRQRGIPKGRQYELQVKSGGVLLAEGFDPQVDYIAQARECTRRPAKDSTP